MSAGARLWKKPHPSWTLFGATFSTRILGTIIAVYGFGLMTAIGWKYAAYMWAYALVWFVFNDVVKMLTYRWLGSGKGKGAVWGSKNPLKPIIRHTQKAEHMVG